MKLTPEIGEEVIYKIMNTPFREYPCPHFVTENVWPEAFFEHIRKMLPPTEYYTGIISSGRVVAPTGTPDTRYLFSVKNDLNKLHNELLEFWKSMSDFFFSDLFRNSVLQKFTPYIQQRFAGRNLTNLQTFPVLELFRDKTDYFIGPHSDHPARLLNLFFYMPEDDSKPHLGTSFYVPKDRNLKYEGGPHFPFEWFTRVFTAPYKRNVLAGFFKNDVSFHGVEKVMEKNFDRNAMAYFMRVQDVTGAPM